MSIGFYNRKRDILSFDFIWQQMVNMEIGFVYIFKGIICCMFDAIVIPILIS